MSNYQLLWITLKVIPGFPACFISTLIVFLGMTGMSYRWAVQRTLCTQSIYLYIMPILTNLRQNRFFIIKLNLKLKAYIKVKCVDFHKNHFVCPLCLSLCPFLPFSKQTYILKGIFRKIWKDLSFFSKQISIWK